MGIGEASPNDSKLHIDNNEIKETQKKKPDKGKYDQGNVKSKDGDVALINETPYFLNLQNTFNEKLS